MKKSIGNFAIESGTVRISDPCYDKKTWCAGTVSGVLKGDWKAAVNLNSEGRVSSLVVTHAKVKPTDKWIALKMTCGVDSGQMSIFDDKFYRKASESVGKITKQWESMAKDKHQEEKDGGAPFYAAACSLTCGNEEDPNHENHGGVMPHGAVSSSGYGDGSYTAYTREDAKGNIVAIKVKFI
jgi:hypothetical protein